MELHDIISVAVLRSYGLRIMARTQQKFRRNNRTQKLTSVGIISSSLNCTMHLPTNANYLKATLCTYEVECNTMHYNLIKVIGKLLDETVLF